MTRTLFSLGTMALAVVAFAQFGSINSTKISERFFNDVPGSNLTVTNVWPRVVFDDQNVSAPNGFANRHIWDLSADGGATPFLFDGSTYFTITWKMTVTGTGVTTKEAGFMLRNPGNGDHQFIVKTSDGEVAAFGGAFPFYLFGLGLYQNGTEVTFGLTYFLDPADNVKKVIYRYNDAVSPALAWSNLEGELLPNTTIGGYIQVVNDPNNPNNGGKAEYDDITVVPSDRVVAERLNVIFGRVSSGNARSLQQADADALTICKFIVPNQNVAPITFEIVGNSPYASLSALTLRSTGRMVTSGSFTQTLDLFDWSANAYSTVDVRTDAFNTVTSTRDLVATGALGRYLDANRNLRGRIRVRQTGPAANPNWCSQHDEAYFVVQP